MRPQPRGIAGSRGPTSGLTSHEIAADVAAVVSELGNGRAVLLGPAVASTVATDYPELAVVVVLAASQVPRTPPNVSTTPFLIANATVPEVERLATLRRAFFPSGHDAGIWLAGWYSDTLKMQREAAAAMPLSVYRACGRVPVLEVFGAYDPFRPTEFWASSALSGATGSHRSSLTMHRTRCFPKQPELVADTVRPWEARFKP